MCTNVLQFTEYVRFLIKGSGFSPQTGFVLSLSLRESRRGLYLLCLRLKLRAVGAYQQYGHSFFFGNR